MGIFHELCWKITYIFYLFHPKPLLCEAMGIHFHANYLVLLQFAVSLHLLCKNKKSHYLDYKTQVKNVVSHIQFEDVYIFDIGFKFMHNVHVLVLAADRDMKQTQ